RTHRPASGPVVLSAALAVGRLVRGAVRFSQLPARSGARPRDPGGGFLPRAGQDARRLRRPDGGGGSLAKVAVSLSPRSFGRLRQQPVAAGQRNRYLYGAVADQSSPYGMSGVLPSRRA